MTEAVCKNSLCAHYDNGCTLKCIQIGGGAYDWLCQNMEPKETRNES